MFSRKASALRKAFDRVGIDLVFPTAPHKILPADAVNPSINERFYGGGQMGDEDWQFWSWGFADDHMRIMSGLDESVDYIAKIMHKEVRPPKGLFVNCVFACLGIDCRGRSSGL